MSMRKLQKIMNATKIQSNTPKYNLRICQCIYVTKHFFCNVLKRQQIILKWYMRYDVPLTDTLSNYTV